MPRAIVPIINRSTKDQAGSSAFVSSLRAIGQIIYSHETSLIIILNIRWKEELQNGFQAIWSKFHQGSSITGPPGATPVYPFPQDLFKSFIGRFCQCVAASGPLSV